MIERISTGIKAAKARGKHLGRKHTLTPHQWREAAKLADEGKSMAGIGALFGVSRTVAWRAAQEVRKATLSLQ